MKVTMFPAKPLPQDLNKEWCVIITDGKLRKKITNQINRIHSYKDRLASLKALHSVVLEQIEDGWNPFNNTYTTEESSSMRFADGLKFALEKKKKTLSRKSFLDYEKVMLFAIGSAPALSIDLLKISEVKKRHIKLLLDQIATDREAVTNKPFTGNSYNKYKRYLSALFQELVEYETIEHNPCRDIREQKEIVTGLHRHATPREKERIKAHLIANYPQLYRFLLFVYYLGMREEEILALKAEHYDAFNQQLVLPPSNVKDREYREVVLPNVFMPDIHAMQIEEMEDDYYLFSKGLLPGPTRLHRNRVTEAWRKVKEELGINVTLYSFKGLGGEAKIRSGIRKSAIGGQWGHNQMSTTDIYLHGEKQRGKDEIQEKTEAF